MPGATVRASRSRRASVWWRPTLRALSLVVASMSAAGCAASDGDGPASEPSLVNECRGASSAMPRSIQEMVDVVNALPKPVELPCLLESLPRPLEVYATLSTLSAQQTFDRAYP